MISESQERMLRDRPARPVGGGPRGLRRRWGLPVAVIGRVTDDGDIAVTTAGAEIARIPAAALTSDAIVHERMSRAPEHRRAAPAPGVPVYPSDRLPERGMDPGRRAARPARDRRTSPRAARCTSSTTRRSARTRWSAPGTVPPCSASRARREALVASTDGNQAVGALDPYLGAAMSVAEATRNVSDHRRPPAGRHELPQLRRPDAARGVLAARRGGARPGRRVPGARAAGHRRQRLALQRVAGRRHRADARDRRRRPAGRHRRP